MSPKYCACVTVTLLLHALWTQSDPTLNEKFSLRLREKRFRSAAVFWSSKKLPMLKLVVAWILLTSALGQTSFLWQQQIKQPKTFHPFYYFHWLAKPALRKQFDLENLDVEREAYRKRLMLWSMAVWTFVASPFMLRQGWSKFKKTAWQNCQNSTKGYKNDIFSLEQTIVFFFGSRR